MARQRMPDCIEVMLVDMAGACETCRHRVQLRHTYRFTDRVVTLQACVVDHDKDGECKAQEITGTIPKCPDWEGI